MNFNSSVEVFKQTIASLLKEQQKEIFSAIQLEKTQTLSNLQGLENRLYEAVYLSNLPNKKLLMNDLTLEAFRRLFVFANEFKEEYLDLVCSRLTLDGF